MVGTRKLFLLLMTFALAVGAEAQEASWEDLVAAGQSAFQAGDYDQAGEKFSVALRIAETFSESDIRLATTLNNLAAVHYMNADYVAAEPMFRRALSIRERSLGRDHVEVATSLNNLAALYREQGNHAAAVPALERARDILEQALGPAHPRTSTIVDKLAAVNRELGQNAPLPKQNLDRRQADQSDPAKRSAVSADLPEIVDPASPYTDDVQAPQTSVVERAEVADRSKEDESQTTALASLPGTTGRTGRVGDAAAAPNVTVDAKAAVAAVDVVGGDNATGGPRFYVQLISMQVEDRVQAEWLRLQVAHADVLGNLRADIVPADLDDRGIWYRLQAGPLADLGVATEACAALADSNQACLIVKR